jgi:hypothetical protein
MVDGVGFDDQLRFEAHAVTSFPRNPQYRRRSLANRFGLSAVFAAFYPMAAIHPPSPETFP